MFFFVVKQKTAYEMRISDWSSDVCSSDLARHGPPCGGPGRGAKENRTPDLFHAMEALYQLSYSPEGGFNLEHERTRRQTAGAAQPTTKLMSLSGTAMTLRTVAPASTPATVAPARADRQGAVGGKRGSVTG